MAKQFDAPTKERMEKVTSFVLDSLMDGFEKHLTKTLLDGKTFLFNKTVGAILTEGKKIDLNMPELAWALLGFNPHQPAWGKLTEVYDISPVKFVACEKIGEVVKNVVGDYSYYFTAGISKETGRIEISTKVHVRGELETIQEKLRRAPKAETKVGVKIGDKVPVMNAPKSKALKYSDVTGAGASYDKAGAALVSTKKSNELLKRQLEILEEALKEAELNAALRARSEERV